jgi:hypothetical protein
MVASSKVVPCKEITATIVLSGVVRFGYTAEFRSLSDSATQFPEKILIRHS